MTDDLRARALALYDRYTHEGLDRRAFVVELTRVGGSAAAAAVLLAGLEADPAAAALVSPSDARLRAGHESLTLNGRTYRAYVARPRAKARRAAVLVIHENRGLNAHIEDVARRTALAGHDAVALDFLSPGGGTPADADAARGAIGKLDLAQATADGVDALRLLRQRLDGTGRVGAVGFCWGGAMVNRLAVAAGPVLDAGVVFYGPAPAGAQAAEVDAPLLIHLAERDARVNATALPWVVALRNAGKSVRAINYHGAEHAFHNDTSAERHDDAAARRAWGETVRFFARHLAL